MKIVTISGKARHGKDTCAFYLKNELESRGHKVYIYRYADPLKMCLTNYFNWDGNKDEKGRTLLQKIGTDKVRSNDQYAWIKIARAIIDGVLFDADYVIIPDCRFPNEITYWGPQLCASLFIIRDGFDSELTEEQKNHASETSLDGFKFDHTIVASSVDGICGACYELVENNYI